METPTTVVPSLLYHYYDRSTGPFRSLGDLEPQEARAQQARFSQRPEWFASRRSPDYVDVRFELEACLRARFVARGGKPERARPHYLTLGACDWLLEWYPDPAVVTLELCRVRDDQVSFTYGDLFPAFRWEGGSGTSGSGREIRPPNPTRGRFFFQSELPDLLVRYGLPQRVNPAGELGPLRYIEAQLWADGPIEGLR